MKLFIIGEENLPYRKRPKATQVCLNITRSHEIKEVLVYEQAVEGFSIGLDFPKRFPVIALTKYELDFEKHSENAYVARDLEMCGDCDMAIVFHDYENDDTDLAVSLLKKQKKNYVVYNISTL